MTDHTEQTDAGAHSVYKAKGMPAYLVLDTSYSMKPYAALLNDTLLNIYDTLYNTPVVKEFVHLSVISFNTVPVVVTPMTDIDELESLPTLTCDGATNLGPLFQLLRTQIAEDVSMLADRGITVLRPVVFMLTDGEPTDQPANAWRKHLDQLHDKSWRAHPNVIAYGFGEAHAAVLKQVATVACYLAEGDVRENADAVSNALISLLNSLVASAKTQQLQLPEEVKGYKTIPLDYVDGVA